MHGWLVYVLQLIKNKKVTVQLVKKLKLQSHELEHTMHNFSLTFLDNLIFLIQKITNMQFSYYVI